MTDKWDEKRGTSTWGADEIASAIDYTADLYEPERVNSQRRADDVGGAGGAEATNSDEEDDKGQEQKQEQAKGRGPSQAQLLVEFASSSEASGASLFHDPDGTTYARIPVGQHTEVWALHSKGFKTWLAHEFYKRTRRTPGGQALADAVLTLDGVAR